MTPLDPLLRPVPAGLRPLLTPSGGPSDQARRLAAILGVSPGALNAICLGSRYHYRPRKARSQFRFPASLAAGESGFPATGPASQLGPNPARLPESEFHSPSG